VEYEPLPFAHPLYILFSSGTTGVPKCIVHSAGGTLLQHLKEHRFHSGVGDGDRLFYFTTCGWMMWNWLASGLASGATLCLFDGSPFAPSGNILWDYAAEERFAVFGTSAKYIDAVRKGGIEPLKTHDLSDLR
ncbi:MAG: acetoacetate--CoA ligase, partial [Mesorhizobium sp.]